MGNAVKRYDKKQVNNFLSTFAKITKNNNMKINLNVPFVDLEGQEVADSNMGKTLANALANSDKGDAIKFWETAIKLQKGEVIDFDTSDQNAIKDFIKATPVSNLVKAQLLLKFEK